MNQSAVIYTAKIGDQTVKAIDKPPGTLYVSLRVTSSSKYLGTIGKPDVDSVKEMLAKTGKVDVFVNESGGYTISANGLSYSVNLTPVHARTVYYFARPLEKDCTAIKTAIESIIGGQMECKFGFVASDGTGTFGTRRAAKLPRNRGSGAKHCRESTVARLALALPETDSLEVSPCQIVVQE